MTVILLFALACGGAAEAPPDREVEPAVKSTPEEVEKTVETTEKAAAGEQIPRLPPAFTGEQIRAAMPVGTTVRLRTTRKDAPTEEATWEVIAADAESVTIRSKVIDQVGEGPPEDKTHRWTELSQHGAFPEAHTKVHEDEVTTALGTHAARRYDITTDAGGQKMVQRFWFANDLAGPPVLMTSTVGGAEVMRMEQVERSSE